MKGNPAHEAAVARLARYVQSSTTPEHRLLREACVLLHRLQDRLDLTSGTRPLPDAHDLATECYALRVKVQTFLGDLVSWRDDIRVPRPDEPEAQEDGE